MTGLIVKQDFKLLRALRNREAVDAKRRNIKRDFRADIEISKLSSQLKFITDHQLKSQSDLKQAAEKAEHQINQINSVLKEAAEINRTTILAIQTIDTYNKYKLIHDEVQASVFKKVLLKKKYQTELETFEKANVLLKKMGIQEHEFTLYREKQKDNEFKMGQLKERLEQEREKRAKLAEIEKTLNQRNQSLISGKERNGLDKRHGER
ncbi:hypothetical protein [Paenibacillus zanthoxyli]|uniref:hypothetical protein n=1 Tax=Paenibacillus zanthoxyli TaxID=369399 RepID=UPI0004723FAF|nr:hypothetical protein [Paenibacillus zanthoxyli]